MGNWEVASAEKESLKEKDEGPRSFYLSPSLQLTSPRLAQVTEG